MTLNLPVITHCIFDMDGLLLDTEGLYTIVQNQIVSRYGKTFTWDLKVKMMGVKALDAAKILIDDLDLSNDMTPAEFVEEREEILHRMFPDSALMPGAEKLIKHLAAHKVPMALATSSYSHLYQLKTTRHRDLFGLLSVIVTGDQVAKGKPDPEIFLKAASSFSDPAPSPSSCLVFEDAPLGVDAALAAGMPVVMVPDPNVNRSLCQNATLVLSSLEAFDPQAWGLPPYA